MTATSASSELERLTPFLGAWDTDGLIRATGVGDASSFRVVDTYERLPGGHFLVHRVDANMPEGRAQGIEIIGYSRDRGDHPMHAFDSTGLASVIRARVEQDTRTFLGDSLRFTGRFRDNGRTFDGTCEMRSVDGSSWQPWMDVTLKRASS